MDDVEAAFEQGFTGADAPAAAVAQAQDGAAARDWAVMQGGPTAKNAEAINSYNTKLSPEDEAKFQAWAAEKWGPGKDADGRTVADVLATYDHRGNWADKEFGPQAAENGHYRDLYKKPNHPTFSDESKYHGVDGNEGGKWVETAKDKWTFEPGPTNLKNYSPAQLQDYLNKMDPDVELKLPPPSLSSVGGLINRAAA